MDFLESFKALLPSGAAWRMTVDRHVLRFLRGLMPAFESVRISQDRAWLDNFPADTRFLKDWENQFNLPPTDLTNDERRARLDGAWKAQGGQDPRYITDTLQAHGFPVFTHEWWDVTPHGVPSPKDPREFLLPEFGGDDVDGFLLGNQTYESTKLGPFAQLGEPEMQCGEPFAQLGNFGAFSTTVIGQQYVGPFCVRPDGLTYFTHPYYMYIGGETFPDTVDIPAARRSEFERLILSIVPGPLYKVLRVRYV